MDVLLPFKLLNAIQADFASVFHVKLVANEEKDDVWFALVHHFIVPRVQIVERLQSRDIVGEENAVGSSVKYLCDALKRFLSRCIPDLKLEDLLLKLDEQGAKLHAYCNLVICQELVISEPMEQTRLADSGIANDDELEKKVLVLDALVFEYFVGHLL